MLLLKKSALTVVNSVGAVGRKWLLLVMPLKGQQEGEEMQNVLLLKHPQREGSCKFTWKNKQLNGEFHSFAVKSFRSESRLPNV